MKFISSGQFNVSEAQIDIWLAVYPTLSPLPALHVAPVCRLEVSILSNIFWSLGMSLECLVFGIHVLQNHPQFKLSANGWSPHNSDCPLHAHILLQHADVYRKTLPVL